MPSSRQLAAILFTDIAGYTAMMQENESAALAVVRHYTAVLGDIVGGHLGTIVNDFGDGHLCTFTSATEAVRCALELQSRLQKEPRVPLRIGLHIGEVIFENEKPFGDGVNVASRIQSLGVANSILFSAEIHSKISNQAEFKTTSLGTFRFKNVTTPMEVFALANEGLVVPARENIEGKLERNGSSVEAASISKKRKRNFAVTSIIALALAMVVYISYEKWLAEPEEKSIAVLPFKNLSTDPNDQYLADGFYEEVINMLSMQQQLVVIGKASSDQVAMAGMTSSDISKKLNARYLLSGTVRKDGDNLRITTHLEDAASGRIVNTKTLDRKIADYFNMQREVATRVVNDVGIILGEGAEMVPGTSNLKALEYYKKAFTKISDLQRIALVKKAVEEDSTYLLAWSSLVSSYLFQYGNFGDSTDLRAAQAAKFRIEAIDKQGYIARITNMEFSYWVLKDYEQVIREANQVLLINPSSSRGLSRRGYAYRRLGKNQEFINDFLLLLRRNPLSLAAKRDIAFTLLSNGQTREAKRFLADLRESGFIGVYYAASLTCLVFESKMNKLDSLAAEWDNDANQSLTEEDKKELRLVKNVVASFYQRDYTALLVPFRIRADPPPEARITFDSAMSFRLSGDSLRSNALFLRSKKLYEKAAAKKAASLESLLANLEYAITLAALGEPAWEKVLAKSKQGLIPFYEGYYYERSTIACIMAGRREEAMKLLTESKKRNILISMDGSIRPFWPLLKNNPLLDPIRKEPGFEKLWDGKHFKALIVFQD